MEQEARENSNNELRTDIDELTALSTQRTKERAHDVIKIVASIGAILISIGLAYGNLMAKDDAFESRLKAVETASRDRDEYIQKDLAEIKAHLHNIEVYLRNGSNRSDNSAGGGK